MDARRDARTHGHTQARTDTRNTHTRTEAHNHVRTRTRRHARTHARTYIQIISFVRTDGAFGFSRVLRYVGVHMHVCICVRVCVCVCVCVYVCICICVHVGVHVRACAYMCHMADQYFARKRMSQCLISSCLRRQHSRCAFLQPFTAFNHLWQTFESAFESAYCQRLTPSVGLCWHLTASHSH